MKTCNTLIALLTSAAIHATGIEIPSAVVDAVAQVEGGKTGSRTREKNGQYSYGRWQISAAFLKDVNRHYGTKIRCADVQTKDFTARHVCECGLAMIMKKRKCDLKTAVAVYNGGWRNRNSKQCRDYAARVMALAKKGATPCPSK
jgi:hypothetical protein